MSQQGTRAAILVRGLSCLLLLITLGSSYAAGSSQRSSQKERAESERGELQQKLKALKNDINKTESAKDKASDALEASEQAISEANRSLRELHTEQAQTEAKLEQLAEEQKRLNARVAQQKKQLSDFLRRQYMHGDSDRIKLLLSGDNPNRIQRELQYMSYISQTQAKMLEALHVSLLAVEKNTLDALEAKAELDEIAREEREHKAALENEKKRRAGLLTQLADKLHAQKKQAANLQKDEQRLSGLVQRLNQLIQEQQKADQAKAEKQQKLLAEQAQRAKNQAGKQAKVSEKNVNPNAIDADQPPAKTTQKIEQAVIAGGTDGREFSRLKGQLRLPVKGELIARFGSKRGDGPSWKGLFIKTLEGAEIKAIAAGKVVFANWYRGYGNMIIVDHGGQYLSLYSNNQAVLKHPGDSVKAGDTIASAGNSGGNEESGLYFELRHQGRVFDPMSWVAKTP